MKLQHKIYKGILSLAGFFIACDAYAQTATMNYVRTSVPRRPITTNTKLDALTTNKDSVMTTIEYLDGLGRPLQTVIQKASPSGYDIVQPIEYDAYGREAVKYLPYRTTNTSYGTYRSDALNTGAGVRYYYNPTGGTLEGQQTSAVVKTPYPFAQTGFEASPLNRVIEQGAPGLAWQNVGTPDANSAKNTLRSVFSTNDQTSFGLNITNNAGSRKVALYTAAINPSGSRSLLRTGNTATYPSGQLDVTITKDENWKPGNGCFGTTEEYRDIEGHIVLKRTYNIKGTIAEQLSTYYVYDDHGNLCFVLPPGVAPDNNAAISQANIDLKCYQYRYDARNRLTQKKVPSKGWEYVVYNKLDKPIATQDSVQRRKAPQEWTITKYDAMGREVISGTYQHPGSTAGVNNLTTVQALADAVTAYWETPVATGTGYTANAWPAIVTTVLSVNYYDAYTGIPGLPTKYDQHTNSAYSQQTRGLLTATKTLVLNTAGDYLWTVPYYDKEGQVIRSFRQHYLGGSSLLSQYNYDDTQTTYSFAKQPLTVLRVHYDRNSAGTAQVVILTSTDTYTYDHMGRKRISYNQLKDGANTAQAKIVVAQSFYNETGQLFKKGLHSINGGASFLQSVNYRYNPRGWLTNINNPTLAADGGLTSSSTNDQFGMELRYDNTTTSRPQYNGNIATVTTKTAPVSGTTYGSLTYDYRYDKLNRLNDAVSSTGAASKDGLHSEYATYNTMGDIAALGRYDNVGGRTQVDTLTYTYSGYRLTRVDDAVTAYAGTWGFSDPVKVANEYTYDGNGNQLKDLNRTITGISYNMLNLPQTFTKSNGNSIAYVYDASGRKLRKISVDVASGNTITTEYVNGIEYDNGTAAVSFIQTEEGRARRSGTVYKYEYDLKDYLGNTRLTTTWDTADVTQRTPINLQHTEYYAFGYTIQSLQNSAPSAKNLYLYNGKELQEEIGLYDYGARFYDPVIGRWTAVDPLAEKSRRFSPYNYVENNPIRNIDPDGMSTESWLAEHGLSDKDLTTVYQAPAEQNDGPGDKKDGPGDKKGDVTQIGTDKDPVIIAWKQRLNSTTYGKTPGERARNWRFWYDWITLEGQFEQNPYQQNAVMPDLPFLEEEGAVKVVKNIKNVKKIVVIGEDMAERVIPYAEKIGAKWFKPRGTKPMNWMKNQVKWIMKQIKDPFTEIIDIGPDLKRPVRSKYYLKELEKINKHIKP